MSSAREKVAAMENKRVREERIRKAVVAGIGVVIAVAIVVTGWVFIKNQTSSNGSTAIGEQLTPKSASQLGFFPVVLPDVQPSKTATRVSYVLDPQCPSCGEFERTTGEYLKSEMVKGDIDLYISPVSFLNGSSTDDYSQRAANALVTVAENSPEHLFDFVQALYKSGNQPQEAAGYIPVSNDKIASWARGVGVPQSVTDTFAAYHYRDWIATHTTNLDNNTTLFPKKLGTPALFVGGTETNGELKGANKVNFTSSYSADLAAAIAAAKK